jgi:hypothetical protein
MPQKVVAHLRSNVIGYLALFVALGGSSYAAVRLAPGSVTTSALAPHAVTHAKLGKSSVSAANIVNRSLTSSDLKPGAILQGLKGDVGSKGAAGPSGLGGIDGLKGDAGPQGPPGRDGSASLGAKARLASAVSAPHGANTNVPVNGGSWTQSAGELDLITGTTTVHTPAGCTGSFGNSLVVSVDGTPTTFAAIPAVPASTTVTVPLVVGTLSEPDSDVQHTLTAQLANSCTGKGEDYSVSDVKIDTIKFR